MNRLGALVRKPWDALAAQPTTSCQIDCFRYSRTSLLSQQRGQNPSQVSRYIKVYAHECTKSLSLSNSAISKQQPKKVQRFQRFSKLGTLRCWRPRSHLELERGSEVPSVNWRKLMEAVGGSLNPKLISIRTSGSSSSEVIRGHPSSKCFHTGSGRNFRPRFHQG